MSGSLLGLKTPHAGDFLTDMATTREPAKQEAGVGVQGQEREGRGMGHESAVGRMNLGELFASEGTSG